MGLMQKLFGQGVAPSASPPSRNHRHTRPSGFDGSSLPPAAAMRRELLRLALRQTLTRNGIPPAWITLQVLDIASREGAPATHIQLVLQHWEPRFLPYVLAFQHEMEQRLLAVEPNAHSWLRGFSWQYAAAPVALVPLPPASTWEAAAAPVPAPAAEAAPLQFEPKPAGPPRRSKQELALLFAKQERGRTRAADHADFAPTQPITH